jgi:two-component system alkaline phosphatase synthesis response regulator PhoP
VENKDITILLVDDEADILEFLGYNLVREGYNVLKAKSGKKALKIASEQKPHLIILDVMMPEMDGMETCRRLRVTPGLSGTLIVFLTARGEDYSQIAGFEAGADDYITKPIKPKLFISRIQAILRRLKQEPAGEIRLVTKEFTIDREKYAVIKDGEEIFLPRKEFELLQFLASRPGKVVSREEIFQSVWGDDVIVGDRTIDVHIRRIREKLNTASIRTIKGVGYKFEEE